MEVIEVMNKINSYLLKNPNDIILLWNWRVTKYGCITLADVKDFLMDPDFESMIIDTKFGWSELITVDNFEVYKSKYKYDFKLNLPDFKRL